MSDEARAMVYSDQLMATDWLEVGFAVDHAIAFDAVFGGGDGDSCTTMIRKITNNHFSGLYRSILVGTSPRAMLERSSRLWNRYYDRGETHADYSGDTSRTGSRRCRTRISRFRRRSGLGA